MTEIVQGVRRAAVAGGGPGRGGRPSVPGHLPPPGGRAAAGGVHRHALQHRLLRALPGQLHGRTGLRVPRLEHPVPRQRGALPARPRAGRDRRRGALAARAGRGRTGRAAGQLRRRLADGGVPVAGGGAQRPAGRRDAAAAGHRGPAAGRPVRGAGRALGPAGGPDGLARRRQSTDERDPLSARSGAGPVRPGERAAVQRRSSSSVTGPRSAIATSASPTGRWPSWTGWPGREPATGCSRSRAAGPTCG